MLKVGAGFQLAIEHVEDVVAIIGRRGRGKTSTATVLVEELHRARHRFCVADPVGVWHGLKSSSDGKSPGLPAIVMGGDHGDVPLEATAGRVIADFVATSDSSVVLDFLHFRKAHMSRFMTDFLEELYTKNRRALHLVLDEADKFIPQRVDGSNAQLVGAAEDVVKMGRARGLLPILITQRPASLNKNALSQAGLLIAHGLTSPHDRKAVDLWVRENATEEQRKAFHASLAGLDRGVAWFWQPEAEIFRQVSVRARTTFDSSSTPKAGGHRAAPKVVAQVDLEQLEQRIRSTIEERKANDPKELRRRIGELERQLAKPTTPAPATVERVEVPILEAPTVKRLEAALVKVDRQGARLSGDVLRLVELHDDIRARLADVRSALAGPFERARPPAAPPRASTTPAPPRAAPRSAQGSGKAVGGGMQRILVALAQRPQGLTIKQVALRAGLSSRSGTFSTYVSRCRQQGWIAGGSKEVLRITDEGLEALGPFEPLPTGAGLLAYWSSQLGGGASRLLEAVAAAYPAELSNDEASAAAGLSGRSGTFSTYVSRLRGLQLIEGARGSGRLRASAELFE
jgi:hypothetical protein